SGALGQGAGEKVCETGVSAWIGLVGLAQIDLVMAHKPAYEGCRQRAAPQPRGESAQAGEQVMGQGGVVALAQTGHGSAEQIVGKSVFCQMQIRVLVKMTHRPTTTGRFWNPSRRWTGACTPCVTGAASGRAPSTRRSWSSVTARTMRS